MFFQSLQVAENKKQRTLYFNCKSVQNWTKKRWIRPNVEEKSL